MDDQQLYEAQYTLAVKQFGDAVSRYAKFKIADGCSKAAFLESARRAAAMAFDIETKNVKFPTLEQHALQMTPRKRG